MAKALRGQYGLTHGSTGDMYKYLWLDLDMKQAMTGIRWALELVENQMVLGLRGIANALRRAKRVRISFEPSGKRLVIDTELIRYKLTYSQQIADLT